ncbi:MAG: gamma-glutamyltransferase [Candidatus Sumerlaeia bacterium]|nr:gamma-glutamyltransferase [Candidatus Sumerlaeia bacterium]
MKKSMKACFVLLALMIGFTPSSRANPDSPTFLSGPYKAGVAAAHPIAVDAGMSILDQGGNAIDAALAVAFTLNVVEPAASGIGGGGFLMYRSAEDGSVEYYDYRETAPAALLRDTFSPEGSPTSGMLARGGLGVGVPGTVKGLLRAHEEHGALPLDIILAPAIKAAREGFVVSELLAGMITDNLDKLADDEAASEAYLEDGIFPLTEGSVLVQEDLAKTLEAIAERGADAIYNEEMAEKIASAVRERGGVMEAADILAFDVTKREPLEGAYRDYQIYTAPPPSSGGIQVLQALGVLEQIDLSTIDPESAHHAAVLITLLNQTALDAFEHVADPGYHPVPIDEMLSEEWRDKMLALLPEMAEVESAKAEEVPVTPGDPGNTTHLSVIDKDGNVVSLTQTINSFFGSGVMVPGTGILLNNEMFDFTAVDGAANFPEPGKKPRSSMTPTILVGSDGQLASIGTPGGLRIPGALLQLLVRRVDHGQNLSEAINAPRLHVDQRRKRVSFEGPVTNELMREALSLLDDPEGWSIQRRSEWDAFFGGAHAVWLEGGIMEISADPRRDGAVAGQ